MVDTDTNFTLSDTNSDYVPSEATTVEPQEYSSNLEDIAETLKVIEKDVRELVIGNRRLCFRIQHLESKLEETSSTFKVLSKISVKRDILPLLIVISFILWLFQE